MENIDNLLQLEAAVDKLLSSLNEMKQEKIVLHAKLDGRGQEIVDLKQQLQVLQSERMQIEKRVSGLLSSIDKWQRLTDSSGVVGKSAGMDDATLF